MDQIVLKRPDDLHLHVRDGAALKSVVPDTAKQFGRAIIMPNLKQPITTVAMAATYRDQILAAVPEGNAFEPLMSLYLTDNTTVQNIEDAANADFVHALKLYPAGATTNSDAGVTDVKNVYPVIEAMQTAGIPLLVHGEVTDPAIDIFDRERIFIETILSPLMDAFPDLKIVMEHITTREAASFVAAGSDHLAATITAHHLLMNRNAIFVGGIRPHHYCLPILKREVHREALMMAATSGSPKFFLGTDSAPHTQGNKENACGCAGMYTALHAMELYTEAFDQADALDKLEGFASQFGADFYGIPRNTDSIVLQRETWQVPDALPLGDDKVVPLRAGEQCYWKMVDA